MVIADYNAIAIPPLIINFIKDIPGNTVNTRPSVPVLGDHARESRSTILRRRYDPVQFEGFDDVRLPWEYLKTRLEHLGIASISTHS